MKMKTILISALIATSTMLFGQAEVFFKAIQQIDMTTISSQMVDEVEICIKDDQRFMPRAKAVSSIKTFLDSVKPKSVEALHSGSSGTGSKYKVAKMTTASGVFRVFVYMENVGGTSKIKEVRFDTF